MSANPLERAAPGPWVAQPFRLLRGRELPASVRATTGDLWVAECGSHDRADANARLIALTPDHALLLRALTDERAWFSTTTENPPVECIRLAAGYPPVELSFPFLRDAAGCPALTPELREALRKAIGIEAANG